MNVFDAGPESDPGVSTDVQAKPFSFSPAVSVLGELCGRKTSSNAPGSTAYGTPARVCARRSASARAQGPANSSGATKALRMISFTRKFGSERF